MSSKTGLDGDFLLDEEIEFAEGGGATMLGLITGWPLTRLSLGFFSAVDFETTLGCVVGLVVSLFSVTTTGVFLGKGVTFCWRGLTGLGGWMSPRFLAFLRSSAASLVTPGTSESGCRHHLVSGGLWTRGRGTRDM